MVQAQCCFPICPSPCAVNVYHAVFRWDRWDKWDNRINTGFAASHLDLIVVGQVGLLRDLGHRVSLELVSLSHRVPRLFVDGGTAGSRIDAGCPTRPLCPTCFCMDVETSINSGALLALPHAPGEDVATCWANAGKSGFLGVLAVVACFKPSCRQ